MDPAYLGFLGVIIGGLITGLVTIVASFIAFKKEHTLWKEKFQSERTKEMDMLKIEKYANFLGAYFYFEGSIGDIIDILENKEEDAIERLSNIAYEPPFENALITLNNEKGWIYLLSTETDITSRVSEMEDLCDEILTHTSRVHCGDLSKEDALKIIQVKQTKLKEISKIISELMRKDAICNL